MKKLRELISNWDDWSGVNCDPAWLLYDSTLRGLRLFAYRVQMQRDCKFGCRTQTSMLKRNYTDSRCWILAVCFRTAWLQSCTNSLLQLRYLSLTVNYQLEINKQWSYPNQWRIQDFPHCGSSLLVGNIFVKNCMEWKNLDREHPLGSATVLVLNYTTSSGNAMIRQKRKNVLNDPCT